MQNSQPSLIYVMPEENRGPGLIDRLAGAIESFLGGWSSGSRDSASGSRADISPGSGWPSRSGDFSGRSANDIQVSWDKDRWSDRGFFTDSLGRPTDFDWHNNPNPSHSDYVHMNARDKEEYEKRNSG